MLVTKRLRHLIALWRPSFLCFTSLPAARNRKVLGLISMLRNEARRKRISLRVPNLKDVTHAIGSEKLTKHERAAMLARRFPVLHWKMPPPRKSYESEHYWMSMFDAVACALAYVVRGDRRFVRRRNVEN